MLIMKKFFLSTRLPKFLLIMLFVIMILIVLATVKDYGVIGDGPLQDDYGHRVFMWYRTLGRDQSFLAYQTNMYMPEHGPFFEVIIAVVQRIIGHHWFTRVLVTSLAGVVGIGAIALCGYLLGGYWVAFLAASSMWLYPRFYGSMFINSKDVPFASATTLILWSVLLLVHQWERKYIRNSILVGFFIGMTTSIRVNAVMWYLFLIIFAGYWWIAHGKETFAQKRIVATVRKQGIVACIIGGVSFITMMLLWPYIFLDPFNHLYESITVMQKYPWNGSVLFNGSTILAQNLPASYIPTWLVIGSPTIVVIFTLIGILTPAIVVFKKKTLNPGIAIVWVSFVFPIVIMLALHTTLYDTMRQFLFVIPAMLLVASYGFITVIKYAWRKKQKLLVGILIITSLASYGFVGVNMVNLHPYEYAYFSEVAGGVNGAVGNYDIDYWGECSKPAAKWLSQNYRKFTTSQSPTVTYLPTFLQPMIYSPPSFSEDDSNPTFFLATVRSGDDKLFPNYKTIHIEYISGSIKACVVKVRPVK